MVERCEPQRGAGHESERSFGEEVWRPQADGYLPVPDEQPSGSCEELGLKLRWELVWRHAFDMLSIWLPSLAPPSPFSPALSITPLGPKLLFTRSHLHPPKNATAHILVFSCMDGKLGTLKFLYGGRNPMTSGMPGILVRFLYNHILIQKLSHPAFWLIKAFLYFLYMDLMA